MKNANKQRIKRWRELAIQFHLRINKETKVIASIEDEHELDIIFNWAEKNQSEETPHGRIADAYMDACLMMHRLEEIEHEFDGYAQLLYFVQIFIRDSLGIQILDIIDQQRLVDGEPGRP